MSQGSKRLVDDHLELHQLLMEVQGALQERDVHRSYSKLDLFWAKLAVHIRAEHLHLFPAILSADGARISTTTSLTEIQSAIDQLRKDHDFFMHQLAGAVGNVRDLINVADKQKIESGLEGIRTTIREVEQRLEGHNEIEEEQVYCWISNLLDQKDQDELASAIRTELEKRPARFAETTW